MWRPAARYGRAAIPDHYRPWLLDVSSLTQRLVSVCTGGFRVQVVAQRWMRPFSDERERLGLPNASLALVRQVRLLCGDKPWVYARTVIPRATLSGRERRLARLGDRPLGAALFADPTLTREVVELAELAPGQTLFDAATSGIASNSSAIWGRRSVFRLSDKPLLVSEIFLSEIPCAPRS
jgi:chorismate--pyruvate lyase